VSLCTLLLIAPSYLEPLAQILHLVPPTPTMWAVIVGFSLTPLVAIQAAVLALQLLRLRARR
jgi:Ca2+-transporting ATPase